MLFKKTMHVKFTNDVACFSDFMRPKLLLDCFIYMTEALYTGKWILSKATDPRLYEAQGPSQEVGPGSPPPSPPPIEMLFQIFKLNFS